MAAIQASVSPDQYITEFCFEDVLVCQESSIGLRVGADGPVNDVTIRGVQSGKCETQTGQGNLCGSDVSGTTAKISTCAWTPVR
jgi:hypothetical protein